MSTKEKTKISKEKWQKIKLVIILAAEFVAIIAVLLLILFAGKKTHTVTFDLDGGILISGELEQRVTQGQHASPPTAAKFGHYLMGWSGSYKSITRDVVLKAIWEYETTPGIVYLMPENTNYCEIESSYKDIQGEIYVGAYHNKLKVLGIREVAFEDRTGITGMYLLDGILAIEKNAFKGCENMSVIEIPSTVVRIGDSAFSGCESLTELVLPEKLQYIGRNAFKDCTSLEKIVLPDGLLKIDEDAFLGCENLKEVVIPKSVTHIGRSAFDSVEMIINLCFSEEEMPEFTAGWCPEDAVLVFNYKPIDEDSDEALEDEDEKDNKKK